MDLTKKMSRTLLRAILPMGLVFALPLAQANEPMIYGINQHLDLGNPGEKAERDYFISMGANQGLTNGSRLKVYRKTATYDLQSRKLHKEIVFPIATLKVIHVESSVAVARLEKLLPSNSTPVINPRAVMVGDLVDQVR